MFPSPGARERLQGKGRRETLGTRLHDYDCHAYDAAANDLNALYD